MADIKISQITPVATTLADSDMFPGSKSGGGSERYTGALLKSEILDSVDDLSAETTLTDAMKTHIIDASGDSKSSTLAVASNYFRDSNKPSYKNLTIKNTVGSVTTSLDIDFDELQIGKIREESYTPQSITLASDMDTGSAPTGGFLYPWVYAGVGQTTICKFSTSATTPAAIAGYTETRCLTGLQVISSALIGISQVNTSVAYSGGSTYVNADNDTVNSLTLSNYLPIAMIKNYTVFVGIDSGTPGFNVYTENASFGSGLDLLGGISYQSKSYFFQNIGGTFYSQRFPGTSGTFTVNFGQAELNI